MTNNLVAKTGWLQLLDIVVKATHAELSGNDWEIYLSQTVVDGTTNAWNQDLEDYPAASTTVGTTIIDTPPTLSGPDEDVIILFSPTYIPGIGDTPVTVYSAVLQRINADTSMRELIAVAELDPPAEITIGFGANVWMRVGCGQCICPE